MRYLFLLLVFATLATTGRGQTTTYQYDWAENIVAGDFRLGDFKYDGEDGIYITGSFRDSLALGDTMLWIEDKEDEWAKDVFLAKYDTAGVLQWAWKAHGEEQSDVKEFGEGSDIELGPGGHIYVQATVGEIDNPNIRIVPNNQDDIVTALFKFSPAGKLVDYMYIKGPNVWAYGMEINEQGEIYMDCSFTGWILIKGETISTIASNNEAIIKLDKDLNVLWGKKLFQTDAHYVTTYVGDVTLDEYGNFYVTGNGCCSMWFDNILLEHPLGHKLIFTAKIQPNGKIDWVRKVGGYGADPFDYGYSTDIEYAKKSMFVSGHYSGGNATNGKDTLPVVTWEDYLLLSYDIDGTPGWVDHGGGLGPDGIGVIEYEPEDDLMVARVGFASQLEIHDTIIDPVDGGGGGTMVLYDLDGKIQSILITELDFWKFKISKPYIYFAGIYREEAVAGNDTFQKPYDPVRTHGFIGRLRYDVRLGTGEQTAIIPGGAEVSIFPNPARDAFRLSYDLVKAQSVEAELLDIRGRTVRSWQYGKQAEGSYQKTISTTDLPTGTYFCRIHIGDQVVVKKMQVHR